MCFHCVRNQRLHGKGGKGKAGKGGDDKARTGGSKGSKKGDKEEESGTSSSRSSRSKSMREDKAGAGKGKGSDKEVLLCCPPISDPQCIPLPPGRANVLALLSLYVFAPPPVRLCSLPHVNTHTHPLALSFPPPLPSYPVRAHPLAFSFSQTKMPIEKLHSGLKRMGAVNGSVIEVTGSGVPLSMFADDRRYLQQIHTYTDARVRTYARTHPATPPPPNAHTRHARYVHTARTHSLA